MLHNLYRRRLLNRFSFIYLHREFVCECLLILNGHFVHIKHTAYSTCKRSTVLAGSEDYRQTIITFGQRCLVYCLRTIIERNTKTCPLINIINSPCICNGNNLLAGQDVGTIQHNILTFTIFISIKNCIYLPLVGSLNIFSVFVSKLSTCLIFVISRERKRLVCKRFAKFCRRQSIFGSRTTIKRTNKKIARSDRHLDQTTKSTSTFSSKLYTGIVITLCHRGCRIICCSSRTCCYCKSGITRSPNCIICSV